MEKQDICKDKCWTHFMEI